jgi:uncharacterized protein
VSLLLRCHKGIGPAVAGAALVTADNFSARYDLDRSKGVFSRPTHKLAGQSYADRILVPDTAKGGVATAWMLHDMTARDIVPRGLIFTGSTRSSRRERPLPASAWSTPSRGNVTQLFHPGDELRVDPAGGLVEILNRDQ